MKAGFREILSNPYSNVVQRSLKPVGLHLQHLLPMLSSIPFSGSTTPPLRENGSVLPSPVMEVTGFLKESCSAIL